ncbi:putative arginine--tRNA ligase, mitochondrial [Styela clava]
MCNSYLNYRYLTSPFKVSLSDFFYRKMRIISYKLYTGTCKYALIFVRRLSSVTAEYVHHTLLEINDSQGEYGFNGKNFKQLNPKTIIVEYSSPNIAKRFHAGHFRSTIIGHAISNIFEAAGNEVIRINYLGDWGMQFAVLSAGFQKYGDKSQVENSPLKHLFEVYVKANDDLKDNCEMKEKAQNLFYKMEHGDEDALNFWKFCSEMSLKEYKNLYKNIGVTFDHFESESMYNKKAHELLNSMRGNKLLLDLENGTEGVNLSATSWKRLKSYNEPACFPTLSRSNGTSLYLTRDVAAAICRKEKYNFDRMIYVTDKSQELHFLQLFSVLEHLGKEWANAANAALEHITFGRVIGMKTRKGNVVFLEDILNEAFTRTQEDRLEHATRKTDIEDLDPVIHILSLSGLICTDLKPKRDKDYRFSWSNVLQSKGHTGINLQYTHCRLESLKRNCGFEVSFEVDCSTLLNEETAINLLNHLWKFEDVTWLAYINLEPSFITKYVFQLGHYVAKALEHLPVKYQPPDIGKPRLLMFHCSQIVLRNCMLLLGMQPLEKM